MDALISIKPVFADLILSGIKTVEVRRRPVNLPLGTRLWIYSTLPVGAIVGYAQIAEILVDHPLLLWKSKRKQLGISFSDYERYTDGRNEVNGLVLEGAKAIIPVGLDTIRKLVGGFRPPQFYAKINPCHQLIPILNDASEFEEQRRRISMCVTK